MTDNKKYHYVVAKYWSSEYNGTPVCVVHKREIDSVGPKLSKVFSEDGKWRNVVATDKLCYTPQDALLLEHVRLSHQLRVAQEEVDRVSRRIDAVNKRGADLGSDIK